MGESVELSQIADAIQQDKETTRKIIQNMMDKYQKKIVVSRSLNWNSLISFAAKRILWMSYPACDASQKPALTDVMLETLSIIAYKQPVTKAEIEKFEASNVTTPSIN